jgi:hypothetical protein
MTTRPQAPMSKLAVRMTEDLILDGKREKTVVAYLAAVRTLSRHFGSSPDRLTEHQVRKYLVMLTSKKKSRPGHSNQSSAA